MLNLMAKILAALLALVLLLVGVVSIALPRLVDSEEFDVALRQSVADALGTPVEWSDVHVGFFPPRLIIDAPTLVAPDIDPAVAGLRAQSVDLRVSPFAILDRRVQIDSFVMRGVELLVTRTAEGLVLPLAAGTEAEAADQPEGEGSEGGPSEGSEGSERGAEQEELELAVRRFALTESVLIVRDRTLEPPVEWRFEAFEFEARGDSIEDPLAIELSSKVARDGREAGRLRTSGEVQLAGRYALDVDLEALRLAELQPYITSAALAGDLTGRARLRGKGDAIAEVETTLRVESLEVRTLGLDLAGRFDLEAKQLAGQPVDFEGLLDLADRGETTIAGRMTPDGAIEAKLDLRALDLAPFARVAGENMKITGFATGPVMLAATPEGDLSRLSADLSVDRARYVDEALDVAGTVDLDLDLTGLGETDPVRFDVAMDLDGGGRVTARGTATLAGAVDTKVALAAVDLARIAAWVPEGTKLDGTLSGDADVRMTAARDIERLATKLRVEAMHLVSLPVDVSGRFDLDARLDGRGPVALVSGLVLDDGSQLRVEGTSTTEGVVDLNAKFDRFDLAILGPFLAAGEADGSAAPATAAPKASEKPGPALVLGGLATGTGRLVGAVAEPEFVALAATVANGKLTTEAYSIAGPFEVDAKLKEPTSRPRGQVDLELSRARVEYSDLFVKKAGMRAKLATRFVPEKTGETVFEGRLDLREVPGILIQGTMAEKTSIALTTPEFDLAGWSEVFPSLAPYAPDGKVVFEGLSAELVEGSAKRFDGRLALRGTGVSVPDAGRVRLRGAIVGDGTRIRTQGLRALIAGATVGIEGSIEDPFGAGRFDLAVETLGATEVNDLLTVLADSGGRIFGPLALNGNVRGVLGEEGEWTESLLGDLRFTVGEGVGGRLRGVSILRTILDQIPLLGGAARLSQPFRGGRSVDDYFSERFDLIEGEFALGGGKVDARTLRLAYPGYEARLSGPMQLRDLQIDMTGEVLLKGDLVSVLGGMAGATVADREPIRIQLARVTNTLGDPKVQMTPETLAIVPKLLFQGTGLDTLTIGIGKGLRKGVERIFEGARGGASGSGSGSDPARPAQPAPAR